MIFKKIKIEIWMYPYFFLIAQFEIAINAWSHGKLLKIKWLFGSDRNYSPDRINGAGVLQQQSQIAGKLLFKDDFHNSCENLY